MAAALLLHCTGLSGRSALPGCCAAGTARVSLRGRHTHIHATPAGCLCGLKRAMRLHAQPFALVAYPALLCGAQCLSRQRHATHAACHEELVSVCCCTILRGRAVQAAPCHVHAARFVRQILPVLLSWRCDQHCDTASHALATARAQRHSFRLSIMLLCPPASLCAHCSSTCASCLQCALQHSLP